MGEPEQASVTDLLAFRHGQRKRAGAKVVADLQVSQLEKARALHKAVGDYIGALEAGWSYCGTIGVAREADIVLAVNALAGSDTISEWADVCGVEL